MERATPSSSTQVFRFGQFEANGTHATLIRKGVPVKLQDQPFRVLILLLERAGEIVTREELRRRLWPDGTFVDFDGSLNVSLKKLRIALDDNADNPRFVETVPRKGYRFIAPVSVSPSLTLEEANRAADSNFSEATTSRVAFVVPKTGKHWWILALVSFLAMPVAWWYARRTNRSNLASTRKVIAVLPFSNEGAGPDFDYLRYAIANDLVTDLTHAHSVSVRPFASTSRYASQPSDPAALGKELRVTHVLAGGYLLDKQDLRVHLELVDVALNQPVWREEVVASPQQLIALHDELAVSTIKGLLPAINGSATATDEMTSPQNEEALDLFLHSITVPLDPEPNRMAIQQLEKSVSLDGGYAPAWGELGWRYYIDYHYGNGGEAAVAKALQAYKRQSELDPSQPPVSTTIRVEQGDLNGAYDQAENFLRKRPDVSIAHYSMSYVLRYAGLLDEAKKECDTALTIDPGFNVFRSCATPFILSGDYAHAGRYIHLDEKSGFGAMLRMIIALRTGNRAATLTESNAVSQVGYKFADIAVMYLNHASGIELSRAAAELEIEPRSSRDPETLYLNAAVLSLCGQGDAALRQLAKAIKGNHCSYPAMDKEPLFDPIRQRPEFLELRQAAIQCQQSFLSHREQVQARLQASRP